MRRLAAPRTATESARGAAARLRAGMGAAFGAAARGPLRVAAGAAFGAAARGPLRVAAAAAVVGVIGGGASGCFDVRPYPGPALCLSVIDCDDGTPCTLDWCNDGECEHIPTAATPPDDGNACTLDKCTGGVETHEVAPKQNGCGNFNDLQCDATGACSGCTAAQQCGDDDPCRTWRCDAGVCATAAAPEGTACNNQGTCDGRGQCVRCNDNVQDGGETDVDCGGPCVALSQEGACAAGKHCDVNADCAAGTTCQDGVCCGAACASSGP